MIRKIVSIAGAVSVVALLGCAVPIVPLKAVDPVKTSLQLSIVKAAEMPHHSTAADRTAPPAKMTGERVTIRSYVGDASNLLQRLAKARGMIFKINGPEPRLPLLVTIDVDSVTFEDLLSQVSFQFGQRADLVLGDNRLEIRYRGQP